MEPVTLDVVVNNLVELALLAVGLVLARYVVPALKSFGASQEAKVDKDTRDRLYAGMNNAIDYGRSMLAGDEPGKLAATDKLKNRVVEFAAGYVKKKFPDSLERLGVSDENLQEMLRARLQQALDLLASPPPKK